MSLIFRLSSGGSSTVSTFSTYNLLVLYKLVPVSEVPIILVWPNKLVVEQFTNTIGTLFTYMYMCRNTLHGN